MILVRNGYVEPTTELKVVPFEKSGLEFRLGRDKCMPRPAAQEAALAGLVPPQQSGGGINLITVHDTAGEGTGPAIYRNLIRRACSIHFAIDRAGFVWQFCDPAIVSCFHMGPGNSRSIGIEMSNAVFPPPPPGVKPGYFAALFSNVKRYTLTGREKLYGRAAIQDDYRGKVRRVLGHFDVQKASLAVLVKTLLREFPTIPRVLPERSKLWADLLEVSPVGVLTRPPLRLVGTKLDPGFQGVASHLHFTDAHVDAAGDWPEGLADLAA
jgi:hypothetical protein